MQIDKDRIQTQDELGEPAAVDQVSERVEAKLKELEEAAKEEVAQGLRNSKGSEIDINQTEK